MKLAALAVSLLALGACASAVRLEAQGSVIQRVIVMLEENKMKVEKDLQSEEKEMAAYAEYCDDETATKGYALKDGDRKIAGIDAAIEDAEGQIGSLDTDIADLGSEMAAKQRDIDAAEATRKAEKGDFRASEVELEKSVEQLENAIIMVKRENATTPAPAFLQAGRGDAPSSAQALAATLGSVIQAAWVGEHDAKALKAFLQGQEAEEEGQGDLSLARAQQEPEAQAEGGSSIAQTLEDINTRAQEALAKARREEMSADFNYQMLRQQLVGGAEAAQKKLSASKEGKASLEQQVGTAKGELADAKKARASDQLFFKSLVKECKTTAENWESRQTEAKGEMAALDKAKELLSKVKVLVQHDDDFLTGNNAAAPRSAARTHLVSSLKDLSHKLNSYALAELASAAVGEPFEKIKGIIGDMVAKLSADMEAQATQKGFCDDEKKKSTEEKEAKSMRADKLKNRVDAGNAKKAALSDYGKELRAQVAEIDKSSAEATAMRGEEHASYLVASTDFKDGAQAVEDAIRVLKDYYAGVSLVQARAGAPALGGSKSDAASSIISILENSEEEFTRMYMESETNENEAQESYEKLAEENTITRAAKVAEIEGSESEIKSLEVAVQNSSADYKLTSQELDAVMEYLDKLKPQCEAKVMTYEQKRTKRVAEIDGLKDALAILDEPALVQTKRHA